MTQGPPAADSILDPNSVEVACPLGRPGTRRWVFAARGLAECFSPEPDQCPNSLRLGGGICCRALLQSVPLVVAPEGAARPGIYGGPAEVNGETALPRRRSRLERMRHRFRRMRNRLADLIFFLVVVPAFIATILFVIESCHSRKSARGGVAEQVQPEVGR